MNENYKINKNGIIINLFVKKINLFYEIIYEI